MQDPKRVNPPVTSDPQPIELGGGLDLVRPKLMVEPGSLLDCKNFEVIDNVGYARIVGCEPYDGTQALYEQTFYRMANATYPYAGITAAYPTGSLIYKSGETVPFGMVLSTNTDGQWTQSGPVVGVTTAIDFILLDSSAEVLVGDDIVNESAAGTFTVSALGIVDMRTGEMVQGLLTTTWQDQPTTAEEFVEDWATHLATVRTEVTALHARPIGLHWFRDRLYAVVAEETIYFDSGGTTELTINQNIGNGTATGRVLNISLTSGTWAGGTAAGYIQFEDYDTGAWTNNTNLNTYADGFGSTITTNIATIAQEADVVGVDPPFFAGMWQSRSHMQAADESADPGWSRLDCGWEVEYDTGYAESGELTKFIKGEHPVYTPGSGNAGPTTANALVQAATVTDEIAQVQGWKSTAAETLWATDADAVETDDTTYLYGDFYTQQWGLASSGAVSTTQPSGGVGAADSHPLAQFDPAGQALAYTAYSTTIFGSNGYTYFLLNGFDGLATALPENARILGITVSCKYDAEVLYKGWPHSDADVWLGFSSVRLEAQLMEYDTDSNEATKIGAAQAAAMDFTFANFTVTHDQTVGSERKARWTKNSESTLTFGSGTDLWGLGTITRARTADEGFTVAFRGRVDCGTTSVPGNGNDNILIYRPLLDYITVTIAYVTDSMRYYFVDGSDVVQGDLVYYNTVEGTFRGGDAAGTMQLVNVTQQAGTKYFIEEGMDIHTAIPASAGNKVGEVASDMVYNGLPSLETLIDNNSRYEFITANFYGTDGLDGFYGVSGAGKAFSVNTYFTEESEASTVTAEYPIKITTNPLDEDGDTPRHVAFHHYHLALGFSSGIVRFSVPGEPETFDGTRGSVETGVGDKVTGLLAMKGMTLGVFCENSIWSITGTDAEQFATQVLAPYTGAIEYTVVDMGIPMYCDSRGISTIEQSAAYGNFQGSRLSKPVTPWILPRMIRYTDLESTQLSRGVACAIPVRAKNHYRVFFRDGQVLVCTINPDAPPSFTFSSYYIGNAAISETDKYLVPLAWSSQVDQRGVERVHVSHYSPTSEISDANGLFVYELERGWGFAGKFIPAFFSTNWYTKDPYKDKTIANIRMDGLTYGYGSAEVTVAKEYEEVYNTVTEPISLPAVTWDTLESDYKPTSHMAHPRRTGRNLSIRIDETGSNAEPTPPSIYQVMLTQFASNGKTDT